MILTFDLGTTYFKACVFDPRSAGNLLAVAARAPGVEHPASGLWELPVAQFHRCLDALVSDLREQCGEVWSQVTAISFASQTNSFCLLDRDDQPLSPLVLWPDLRGANQVSHFAGLWSDPQHHARTGIPNGGAEFMVTKLRSLSQTPVWRDVSRVCLISDYLAWYLTGEHVTEAGAMGLTGLLDIHDLSYRPAMVRAAGLDEAMLPRALRAGSDLGAIRAQAAKHWSLPRTCRMVMGCLDQYAGAIGAGNVGPGNFSETTGTVLAAVRCRDRFDPVMRTDVFQGPGAIPGVYYQMTFGSISANLLEAWRNHLSDRPSFAALDELAARVPVGCEGLRLAEHPDVLQPQAILAQHPRRHDRGHAVRAILEAVAVALREQVRLLYGDDRPAAIRSVGGAARSALWRQIKADVLGVPVMATTCPEPTSLGAAILAASAAEELSIEAIADAWVRTASPLEPDMAAHDMYRAVYPQIAR